MHSASEYAEILCVCTDLIIVILTIIKPIFCHIPFHIKVLHVIYTI